ncbi:MAG: AAA family ATPase [Hyphomicrobiales bacterium]|nr:MAG: AAA family ATPase [Hyphomicrobiales bacterium]
MPHDKVDGNSAVFRLSRLTNANDRPLSKTITLENGQLKSTAAAEMSAGTVEHLEVTGIEALSDVIEGCRPSQALALGLVIASKRPKLGELRKVVTDKVLSKHPDAIARTKAFFTFESGPGSMLLDFDTNQMPARVANRLASRGGFLGALINVFPAMDNAALIVRASTSSGIYNGDTGEAYKGSNGQHMHLAVTDAQDISRALAAAHQRLILAGYGWCLVSKDGRLHTRSIADSLVGSPERLCFEGNAVLITPLKQDQEARECTIYNGELLDTRAVFRDLDADEQRRFNELMEGLRAERTEDAAKARQNANKRLADDMVRKGVSRKEAQRRAEQRDENELPSDMVLEFDDKELGSVTVAEVYAEPKKYIGKTLADPWEPEYGRCKARIDRNENTRRLYATSYAHGFTSYDLLPPEDVENALHREKVDHLKAIFENAPIDWDLVTELAAYNQERFGGKDSHEEDEDQASYEAGEAEESDPFCQGDETEEDALKGVWFHGDAPPEPTPMLIERILPAHGLTFLGGQSGAAKSFLAVDLSAAAVLGDAFFVMKAEELVGVIYIAGEGAATISTRFAAAIKAREVSDEKLPFALVRDVPDLSSKTERKQFAKRLAAVAKRIKETFGVRVGLIVIDTLGACFSMKDENSAAEMNAVCKAAASLGTGIGAATLVLAHYGKSQEAGIRGSSAIRAAAESVIAALGERKELEGECTRRRIVLVKSRDGEEGETHHFDLEHVQLGHDADGKPFGAARIVRAGKPEPEAKGTKQERATKGFALTYDRLAASVEETTDEDGVLGRRVSVKAIREAMRGKYLELDDKGKITAGSRQAFSRAQRVLVDSGCFDQSEDLIWRTFCESAAA